MYMQASGQNNNSKLAITYKNCLICNEGTIQLHSHNYSLTSKRMRTAKENEHLLITHYTCSYSEVLCTSGVTKFNVCRPSCVGMYLCARDSIRTLFEVIMHTYRFLKTHSACNKLRAEEFYIHVWKHHNLLRLCNSNSIFSCACVAVAVLTIKQNKASASRTT